MLRLRFFLRTLLVVVAAGSFLATSALSLDQAGHYHREAQIRASRPTCVNGVKQLALAVAISQRPTRLTLRRRVEVEVNLHAQRINSAFNQLCSTLDPATLNPTK
jgi:hypothetical protein